MTPHFYDDKPCLRLYCYVVPKGRAHYHWHNAEHGKSPFGPIHHKHYYPANSRQP